MPLGTRTQGWGRLGSWLDTLTLLFSGGRRKGKQAWRDFIGRYLPQRAEWADLLCDSFRNKLMHHYSVKDIQLTQGSPARHWRVEAGILMLDLGELIAELEAAAERFFAELEQDLNLRGRALARFRELPSLAPAPTVTTSVEVDEGVTMSISGSYAASGSYLPPAKQEARRSRLIPAARSISPWQLLLVGRDGFPDVGSSQLGCVTTSKRPRPQASGR